MKRVFFIYKLTTPTGKIYIGQTYNINRRFSSYRNLNCEGQIKLFSSIKKYGWDKIKKEILFDGLITQKEIDEKEIDFIAKYSKNNNLLNLSLGGNSPYYKTGKDHYASKPVLQLNKKGEIINEFESATIASKELIVSQTCISLSCRSENPFSVGYYWRFKEGFDKNIFLKLLEKPNPRCKQIVQLDLMGNFIKEWDSATEASKELNINKKNIYRLISGIGISSGGFCWVSKKDYENGFIEIKKPKTTTSKRIRVSEIDGAYICEYDSISEASRMLNIDKTTIIRQLKNKVINPKKYKYEYL